MESVGRIKGMVRYQKTCHFDAPSNLADSISSVGTFCNAESTNTVGIATPCQIATTRTPAWAPNLLASMLDFNASIPSKFPINGNPDP